MAAIGLAGKTIAAMAAPTGSGDSYWTGRIRPTDGALPLIEHGYMPHPHSHALRRGRWSEPGRVYLITFTTFERRCYFSDWFAACATARNLSSIHAWTDAHLLCWMLMPDHWHGLIELGAIENLSRAVGRAKAYAARDWKRHHADRLWAPGFHDRAIRSSDSLLDAARYIVANPVRAGLARRIGDYPFWDAIWIED